ncbi:hypothetical protein QOT17_021233 [Balamuthia mandrillaris]
MKKGAGLCPRWAYVGQKNTSKQAILRSKLMAASVKILSSHDVDRELEEIVSLLENKDEEWDERNKAMQRLVAVTEASLGQWQPRLVASLDKLKTPFVVQLQDLRSLVVKEACATLSTLAELLKDSMDSLAEYLFPSLFKLTVVKTMVMSQAGHEALLAFVQHISPNVTLAAILENSRDKNVSIRKRCMEYVAQLLDDGRDHALEMLSRQRDAIASMVDLGVADASPDVRTVSRACFWAFHRRWPDKAADMLKTFDSGAQKALAREQHSSAPSSSLRSSFASGGSRRPALSKKASKVPVVASSMTTVGRPSHKKRLSELPPISQPGSIRAIKAAPRIPQSSMWSSTATPIGLQNTNNLHSSSTSHPLISESSHTIDIPASVMKSKNIPLSSRCDSSHTTSFSFDFKSLSSSSSTTRFGTDGIHRGAQRVPLTNATVVPSPGDDFGVEIYLPPPKNSFLRDSPLSSSSTEMLMEQMPTGFSSQAPTTTSSSLSSPFTSSMSFEISWNNEDTASNKDSLRKSKRRKALQQRLGCARSSTPDEPAASSPESLDDSKQKKNHSTQRNDLALEVLAPPHQCSTHAGTSVEEMVEAIPTGVAQNVPLPEMAPFAPSSLESSSLSPSVPSSAATATTIQQQQSEVIATVSLSALNTAGAIPSQQVMAEPVAARQKVDPEVTVRQGEWTIDGENDEAAAYDGEDDLPVMKIEERVEQMPEDRLELEMADEEQHQQHCEVAVLPVAAHDSQQEVEQKQEQEHVTNETRQEHKQEKEKEAAQDIKEEQDLSTLCFESRCLLVAVNQLLMEDVSFLNSFREEGCTLVAALKKWNRDTQPLKDPQALVLAQQALALILRCILHCLSNRRKLLGQDLLEKVLTLCQVKGEGTEWGNYCMELLLDWLVVFTKSMQTTAKREEASLTVSQLLSLLKRIVPHISVPILSLHSPSLLPTLHLAMNHPRAHVRKEAVEVTAALCGLIKKKETVSVFVGEGQEEGMSPELVALLQPFLMKLSPVQHQLLQNYPYPSCARAV